MLVVVGKEPPQCVLHFQGDNIFYPKSWFYAELGGIDGINDAKIDYKDENAEFLIALNYKETEYCGIHMNIQ